MTLTCGGTAQFVPDSALEEDGFELPVPGHGFLSQVGLSFSMSMATRAGENRMPLTRSLLGKP
jgi:hypothetical protein